MTTIYEYAGFHYDIEFDAGRGFFYAKPVVGQHAAASKDKHCRAAVQQWTDEGRPGLARTAHTLTYHDEHVDTRRRGPVGNEKEANTMEIINSVVERLHWYAITRYALKPRRNVLRARILRWTNNDPVRITELSVCALSTIPKELLSLRANRARS